MWVSVRVQPATFSLPKIHKCVCVHSIVITYMTKLPKKSLWKREWNIAQQQHRQQSTSRKRRTFVHRQTHTHTHIHLIYVVLYIFTWKYTTFIHRCNRTARRGSMGISRFFFSALTSHNIVWPRNKESSYFLFLIFNVVFAVVGLNR